jgi:hypothetical protein
MVDIYRVFHQTTWQYSFFSEVHGTFSKIDHILGHKASLNKCKKIKITRYHSRIKLDVNNKRNPRKYSNTWRLNSTLLKNQWVTKTIREEIKKSLESSENENTTWQNLCNIAKAMQRGKFIAISAYIKKKKVQSNDAP